MRSLFLAALSFLTLWGDAHIFVYHRFGDDAHASANTSIQTLNTQFEYFKTHGYEVVEMRRLAEALHQHKPIPDNWVVLTIDDGYRSFYQNGLPVFKKYGYPFTLFVYVEATQKGYGDFMSWEELRQSAAYGEIALHSYSHAHMTSMGTQDILKETQEARAIFKHEMGFDARYYAYPYGEYKHETQKAIKTFGFDLICNQNSGAVNEKSDPYDLDRTALTGDVTLAPKLSVRALDTLWLEPKKYPKNGNLKSIHAKIAPTIAQVEYYVSGYGWERVGVHNGDVNITFNKPLKFSRNRIFLKSGHYQSSIILVKE